MNESNINEELLLNQNTDNSQEKDDTPELIICKLKQKNAFLEKILAELPIAVYIHDCNTMQQVWGNPQSEKRIGVSVKELNERGIDWFLNQYHPDDIAIINENIEAFTKNKSNEFSGVYRYKNDDDQKWHWNYSKTVRLSEDDNKINSLILGIAVDLTTPMDTQKQTETIMKENNKIRNKIILNKLTEREKQVLHHIGMGKNNASIAEEFKVSYHTITTHRKNIAKKLKLHCLASIAAFAIENGL